MEKIQKTITDPCLLDLRVGLNSSTLNLESTTTKEFLSINCSCGKAVKLTILYEPDNIQEIEYDDESLDTILGGSDNWVYIYDGKNEISIVNKWIEQFNSNNIEWEESWKDLDSDVYYSLIILEYYKGANESDTIYVNDLGGNEDYDYPMFAGDNNWCKCTLESNWVFTYESISDNPYNKPRVAYFEHKTKDKRLKSGKYAGHKVYDKWGVIIVQKPNLNATDKQVTEYDLIGEKTDNQNYIDGPLYSIGIISNANFNVNSIEFNSQYKTDLRNALEYFKDNNVKFISNIGDLCVNDNKDIIKFEEYYRLYAYYYEMRMFTCLGEYDYMKIYDKEKNKNIYNQINKFNMNNIYKDIKYFEYEGSWDQINSGERNIKGKTNYYFTYKNENSDIEDIFIYLSVDYGTNKNSINHYLSRAINKLDYNDKYVKELIPFAVEAGYKKEIDGNFDYQFYNSNTLIWLKDIIENNLDKHIFVFMHHGLPHKAGNGTSYNKTKDGFNYSYYSENKIYPYDSHSAIAKSIEHSGSNSLCGLQFYFLNNLNNKYKNVTWFSGHSCYSWEDGDPSFVNQFTGDQYLSFCDKDFDIYKPTGNEYYQNPADSNSISKDYNKKIYSRYPLNIENQRYEDKPIGTSAWNIHIPSLSCPLSRNNYKLYKSSEGAILDIYANGYKIRQILFKDAYSSNYINTVIGEKRILFK